MDKHVAELDDLRLTWNFKNQGDPLKTGGKYRIPELDPITGCRLAFKLEIINVTADDEGDYSCHQSCKDSYGDHCKSSAQLELKVYSAFATRGKKRLSACRNPKRYSKEFNFVLLLTEEGWHLPVKIFEDFGADASKSSVEFELKVFLPSPTTGKVR